MFATAKSILRLSTGAAAICAGLALPAGAQEADQPTRTTETFGDWVLECVTPPAKDDAAEAPAPQCEMRTQVTTRGDDDVQRPLIQLGIGHLGLEKGSWIVVQTPLNVKLQEGVRIVLDAPEGEAEGEALVKTRFIYCEQTHCVSQGRMDTAQAEALGEAEGARAVFVAAPENELEIPLSLDGYAEARAAMLK